MRRGIKLKEGEGVDWTYPWGNTLELFKMADCRVINLETSVTSMWHIYLLKALAFSIEP